MQGLDIGPDSLKAFQSALADAKTIIWNGPMGVFEFEKFAKGTFGVADTLAELSAKVRLPVMLPSWWMQFGGNLLKILLHSVTLHLCMLTASCGHFTCARVLVKCLSNCINETK